jgi:hypothetical protein
MKKFEKFGIEIEFFNVAEGRMERALKSKGLFSWKVTRDWSINGENPIELNSPILYSKGNSGLKQIKKVIDILHDLNAKVNSSCSIHIHVDRSDLTDAEIATLIYRYKIFESEIDKFIIKSRRSNSNHFCKSLARVGNGELIEKVLDRNLDKYFKCSNNPLNHYNTIEFRQFGPLLNYDAVKNWIEFIFDFIRASKKLSRTYIKKTSDLSLLEKKIVKQLATPKTLSNLFLFFPKKIDIGDLEIALENLRKRNDEVYIKKYAGVYRIQKDKSPLYSSLSHESRIVSNNNDNLWFGISPSVKSYFEKMATYLEKRTKINFKAINFLKI